MEIKNNFSTLFEKYYIRDNLSKNEYSDFIKEDGKVSLQKLADAFSNIEKVFNFRLPEMYKDFIESKVSWGVEGANNSFRIYDEKELYEFNYIGSHQGNSSLEEMKNYFLFGQDDGECSYFFDPLNKLGYGVNVVWKINRGFLDGNNTWFDLVSENFYTFIKDCIEKKDTDSNYVFYTESNSCDLTAKDYVIYLENECKKILERKKNTQDEIEGIKNYLNVIKTKMEYYSEVFNDEHFVFIKENENEFLENIALTNLLYNIININFIILSCKKMRFLFLTSNILKKHNSFLWKKKMFVFACNERSLLSNDSLSWDLFFIDPTNKLGKGTDAIYMINENSKKIEESCYVAKDIVDLFRIFAKDEQINTTPIRISSL